MSGSCYYKNYWAPDFNTSSVGSKYLIKFNRNNSGHKEVKTSIDGIDKQLMPSLRSPALGSLPISDSEYNRLHDILNETDLEFQASLLKRWSIRVGRLAPWASNERNGLMRRWFTRINRMTKAERLLFVDSSTLSGLSSMPFANIISGEDKVDNIVSGEHKVANVENGEANDQVEASRDNASAFINSEGQIDSTLCPKLINTWETRANRKTPFPRAVADKLLTAWLGHESTWTDYERVVFCAAHDPEVENINEVSDEEKFRLLESLVPHSDDRAEPLLNGRYAQKTTSDEAADEAFATALDAESGPAISEYEKELKQFLSSDMQQHAKLVKSTIGKNQRLIRLLKYDETVDLNTIKQALFPESYFEITFQQFGC